jgi:hypothetical protein
MASDPNALRSRRAILAAAVGGAAAVAASAAAPLTVSAAPTPMLTETGNTSASQTTLSMTPSVPADGVTFKAENAATFSAALVGAAGDQSNLATDTSWTGVYGWVPGVPPEITDAYGTGIWGDSDDVGVIGSGSLGVRGEGYFGVVAAGGQGGTGLRTWGYDGAGNDIALDVRGKALFSRSGRSTIGAGKSSIKVNLAGATWSSLVFAVLRSNRSGRYVRAVVPTTGSFTIYLNTTVTSSTYVVWFVVN